MKNPFTVARNCDAVVQTILRPQAVGAILNLDLHGIAAATLRARNPSDLLDFEVYTQAQDFRDAKAAIETAARRR